MNLKLASIAFAASSAFAVSAFADIDPYEHVIDTDPSKDEVVIDFADALSDAEVKGFARTLGLEVRLNSEHSDEANVYIADVAEGDVERWQALLSEKAPSDWIEGTEENIEYHMLGAPNDPLYQYQWNFKQVNAEAAWGISSGKDVIVAVIDTGVAVEDKPEKKIKAAKDLAGTATVGGYDFVDNDAFPWDGHGHGTHVAGTIAQTTNNKYGVAGLAYNAKIMPLRVLNSRGFGQVADIADSIRFAADNGAKVINMSLGGPLPSLVMKRACEYAYKKGVTIIAAAGNGGKRAPSYPASYDHVVAVAATQYDRSTTFYSQWGKFVDIAAPGGNTRVDQDRDGRPDGVMQQTLKNGRTDQHDFLLYMGTSMASPHVAGIAAMVISQGVTHPDRVEEVLKRTATDSEKKKFKGKEKEYTERYGAGIVQADGAVKAANGTQGGLRLFFAFLLSGFGLASLRRRDSLDMTTTKQRATTVGVAALTGAGAFVLPWFLGDVSLFAPIIDIVSRPIAEWDAAILGFGYHQNPILASAAIPLAAYAFMGHKGRYLASGIAFGFAAFCFSEAIWLTSDVQWIPGMEWLDRGWLAVNGVIAGALGIVGLRRY